MKAPRFVQITANGDGLYALDETGAVWRYEKESNEQSPKRFAFWVALTQHRSAPTAPPKDYKDA